MGVDDDSADFVPTFCFLLETLSALDLHALESAGQPCAAPVATPACDEMPLELARQLVGFMRGPAAVDVGVPSPIPNVAFLDDASGGRWVVLETGETADLEAVADAYRAGAAVERRYVAELESEVRQAKRSLDAEGASASLSTERQGALRHLERQASVLKDGLCDDSDRAGILGAAWSFGNVARTAPHTAMPGMSNSANGEVPQAEGSPLELLSRFRRLAARLERANPSHAGEVPRQVRPVVGQEVDVPDVLCLDGCSGFAPWMESIFARGSLCDPALVLPSEAVVVAVDGEPAYLRGRGWRITRDRVLVGWDWRGERGLVPCAGVDTAPLRGSDGLVNASEVPLGGWVHFGGYRWWNRDGSGTLYDESLMEWEDRRQRLIGQVRRRLRDGRGVTPSAWRWVVWTLVGHYMLPDDWRLGEEDIEWRPAEGPAGGASGDQGSLPAVVDELRYSASPQTGLAEWRDILAHDRKWSESFLPETLRSHALMRLIEGRAGGDDADFLEAWLRDVRSWVAGCQSGEAAEVHRSFLGSAVGEGGYDAFWRETREAQVYAAERDQEFAAMRRQHAEWHSAHARLVRLSKRIQQDGREAFEWQAEPWTADGFAEPFLVPEAFRVPEAEEGEAFDFGALPDQGNGLPGKPAAFLHPENIMRRLRPEARPAVVQAALAADPLVVDEGASQATAFKGVALPSDPAGLVSQDAAALGLDNAAMSNRMQRIFDEAKDLLISRWTS